MDLLTRDDLKDLMAVRGPECVSIYLPTHRAGFETKQDPIRFKNLLGEASLRLAAAGVRPSEAGKRLAPARRLLQDSLFWSRQGDGLAVFIAPGFFRRYSLPVAFSEIVFVAGRLHLNPLLPLFTGEGRFYILALSQNRVRLFEGTRYSIGEVDLAGGPRNLAEAIQADTPERSIRHRAGLSGGTGAVFHGHGFGDEDLKENLRRFFLQVDKGLQEALRDERAPLVLAGVEYLLPIYREASSYPFLVGEGIAGNPEELGIDELHARGRDIVRTLFLESQEKAMDQYRQLVGTGRATSDIKIVVPASRHGRVETLFVAAGMHRWGTFDPATDAVHLHRKPQPDDDDLLDLTAIQTLLTGGTVYALERGKVPDGGIMAAVFRY